MNINDLKNKKILVLGLGREGMSVLKFLEKYFPNKKVDVADQKNPENIPVNVDKQYFGDNYLIHLNNYEVIIKSPGIPYSKEIYDAKEKGVEITSITKLFFDNFPGKIVGVTGTKGKSTTSSLIYQVLRIGPDLIGAGGLDAYLLGNIGKPALEILNSADENSVAVYELSSFQLEDLEKSPHIAVITNIYPEHLDHHGNLDAYINAKFNITKHQTVHDYFIWNKNIPQLQKFAKQSLAQTLAFTTDPLELVKDSDVPLLGDFNIGNINAAVLVGQIFKISEDKILEAIKNFAPLPHRLEFAGEFKGIQFYNDSLSTIPQALIAALKTLGKDVETLIAGGFDRGIDYNILGPVIAKSGVKNLILFPTTGQKIWNSVASHHPNFRKFDVHNMEDAVRIAYEVTSPGKIVLLSPASTSFNLFRDYADRGDQFKEFLKDMS